MGLPDEVEFHSPASYRLGIRVESIINLCYTFSIMNNQDTIRQQLQSYLEGDGAHISLDAAVDGFPLEMAGAKVPDLHHTAWQLLDHIRIAQWDIVEFSRDPDHKSPEFPSGYWSEQDAPAEPGAWGACIEQIHRDLEVMKKLLIDPQTDLFAPIPHGSGQTIFREVLLIVDHNAYHLAQLVDIRMLLGVPVRNS